MKTPFGIACLLAASATAAAGATLDATAGLGGVAKAGRWTPITVSVTAAGDALEGELLIEWGDARLRRPVAVTAGSRKDFDLYLRTGDPRGAINVRFMAGAREVASVAAPVRILGFDEPVAVCILADATAAASGECTTAVLARNLPRSPRGYEAADRVMWAGTTAPLTPEQDAALRAWRSIEALDASGDLGLTPQVSRPQLPRGLPATLVPVVVAVGGAYLAALIAGAAWLRARRAPLAWTAGGVAVLIASASVAVGGIGRIGATRTVHLHHVSLLQQLPGTGASLLTMRAIAEFPAFDAFAVRLPALDGVLETTTPRGGSEERLDADGYPIVAGVFGTAGRQAFAGEAVVTASPLEVDEHAGGAVIENRSAGTLRDCRFGGGLAVEPGITRLAPGARVEASFSGAHDAAPSGPLVTCVSDDPPVPLTEARRPVVMHGVTTVAVYRQTPQRGEGGD